MIRKAELEAEYRVAWMSEKAGDLHAGEGRDTGVQARAGPVFGVDSCCTWADIRSAAGQGRPDTAGASAAVDRDKDRPVSFAAGKGY